MNILESHLSRWKSKGYRMTKNRAALLDLFLKEKIPLSIQEIQKKLKQKKHTADPSTIYREIEFLIQEKVIQELTLKERKRLFELSFKDHHHHLFCLKCEKIQEIEMNDELSKLEEKIEKENDFQIESHTLDFFGTCAKCLHS